jgi:hypothetical protein
MLSEAKHLIIYSSNIAKGDTMNIKCSFCQMPYTLSRVEMLDALQEMDAGKMSHYDAHCPRCRRATPVERRRMEIFFPNWRDALKQFEAEMKAHPQHEAPLPAPETVSASQPESTPEPAIAKPSAKKTEKAPAARAKSRSAGGRKAPAKKK